MHGRGSNYTDLAGTQVDSLICLGDIIGTGRIQCKCLECGTIQEKEKKTFKALLNRVATSNGSKHLTCNNKLCKYHSYRIDAFAIGTIHESLKIIEKIDSNKIKTECIYCGFISTLTVGAVKTSGHCRSKQCIAYKTPKPKNQFIIGDIYNNMKIMSYSVAKQQYEVQCIECGTLFEVTSTYLKDNGNHCKNISCKNFARAHSAAHLIGTIKHNLKCIDYVRVASVRGILVECQVCGEQFLVTNISRFKNNLVACTNKKCSNSCKCIKEMKPMAGMETSRLQVLYDIDSKFAQVECKLCKTQFSLTKTSLKRGSSLCKNNNCLYSRSDIHLKNIGTIKGDFKILSRPEVNKYLCECVICGHKEYKEKAPTYNERCIYHPHAYKKFEGLFNNFVIEANAYTYKEDDYFICNCTKCGYRDILTVPEMLQHQCEERNFKNE